MGKISQFKNQTSAEKAFIAAMKAGEPCVLGKERPTDDQLAECSIRAELLAMVITGDCDDCPAPRGGVDVTGAYVTGQLDLTNAEAASDVGLWKCRFEYPFGARQTQFKSLYLDGSALPGLNAQGASFAGNVFLCDDFHATGEVNLANSKIGGQLSCIAGRFENEGGLALNAQGLQVTDAIFLRDGFHAKGEVSLAGAKIEGQLTCVAGRFDNLGGFALNAESLQVKGTVFLSENFHAFGAVSFVGATISGQLECREGRFENPKGYALIAQDLEVKGSASLRSEFHAIGEVNLSGAKIGGQLNCRAGRFENAVGHALNAQGVHVGRDVFLSDQFHSTGAVRFSGASIGGQFACSKGRFENPNGTALNAQRMSVAEGLLWRDVASGAGRYNFASSTVGDLVDDLDSWPKGDGQLYLDGFTYERIAGIFTDAPRRLEWLRRGTVHDDTFYPQPYNQLAKVLRQMGHDRQARIVLIELQRLLAVDQLREDRGSIARLWAGDPSQRGDIGFQWQRMWRGRIWDWLLRSVVGYGHAPRRALYWSAAILIVSTLFYFLAWNAGGMVPNSDIILNSRDWAYAMKEAAEAPGPYWAERMDSQFHPSAKHYETFYAGPYAADLFIPLLDFGQESAWAATTANWWGWLALVISYILKFSGWVITGLGIAAITGIMQRNSPDS